MIDALFLHFLDDAGLQACVLCFYFFFTSIWSTQNSKVMIKQYQEELVSCDKQVINLGHPTKTVVGMAALVSSVVCKQEGRMFQRNKDTSSMVVAWSGEGLFRLN